jgi:hypothetical protein
MSGEFDFDQAQIETSQLKEKANPFTDPLKYQIHKDKRYISERNTSSIAWTMLKKKSHQNLVSLITDSQSRTRYPEDMIRRTLLCGLITIYC